MKGLLFWFFYEMKDLPKGQSESYIEEEQTLQWPKELSTLMKKQFKTIEGYIFISSLLLDIDERFKWVNGEI